MGLIVGLLIWFAGAFAVALSYQLGYRRRAAAEGVHLATVFGLAVMAAVFLAALAQSFWIASATAPS
ncbi:MAG: hypothetical protein AAF869_03790 [Pseudomonadota bacterium]